MSIYICVVITYVSVIRIHQFSVWGLTFSGAGDASFLCLDNHFVIFGLLWADGLCAPSSLVTTSKCVGHLHFQL